MSTLSARARFYGGGFISSYSQMFFSDNRAFAYWLLIASFANWSSGLAGAVAVLVSLAFSKWLGLDTISIQSGYFSYNALLLGLAMGLYYEYSAGFWILLFVFSFLTVFLSKSIGVLFQKYGLPILNLPFILTLWVLSLSVKNFQAISMSERGLFKLNELYDAGGMTLVKVYEWLNDLILPPVMEAYFKTLGAIYFQFSTIAGIFIAIGLLLYSRIAFTLSVIGFLTGFYFFQILNGTVNPYLYAFVGFNYVLAAISLGGFYVIPSKKSYALAVVAAMIIAIVYAALYSIFLRLQLPVYSFPCTSTVLLVVLSLKYKTNSNGLELVSLQAYSPEKNLYNHLYRAERYRNDTFVHIYPPFYGDWYVSQGHNGGITHLGDWQYAWDFVIVDDAGNPFRNRGFELSDYYCYNLPVLAPAAGYVVHVVNEVDDNAVGGVDTLQNWGNTIVIKHTEGVYSKLSHLKRDTFKVAVGDYVYRGQWLANCGNSGRSPEPHVHFQVQAMPHIGSKTMKYPLAYYLSKSGDGNPTFHSFDVPSEKTVVSGIQTTNLITEAFNWIPGSILSWEIQNQGAIKWEVFTDAYNQTYLFCEQTRSYAYFVNNGTLLYFTDFVGDRQSALYKFYVGFHKVLLAHYAALKVDDLLPIAGFYGGFIKIVQDFMAPFYVFLKTQYRCQFTEVDDVNYPRVAVFESHAKVMMGKTARKSWSFKAVIDNKGIREFATENLILNRI